MSAGADLAIVTNDTSGRGRAAEVVGRLRRAAARRGHVTAELDADDADATRAAVAALPDHVRRIVAVGGDGLVHHVIQHLAGTDRELGVVPVGTGNDFAAALGIPDDTNAAIEIALGPTQPLDAIHSEHGWAASVATAGFSAVVNATADRIPLPLGSRIYTAATIVELPRLRSWPAMLTLDGTEVEAETMMLAVANTPRFGGGMQICPDADPTDGLLDVTSISPVSRLTLLRVFPKVFAGEHLDHPAVRTWRAKEVVVEAAGDRWGDGERMGPSPVRLHAEPGALRVARPRH
ncbi:MAG: YegS/Rv2252/BmrU family lipid kinase [Actinomycetota bacterium]